MLTRKEIEKRLLKIDPQLISIFAARCSLRVLPMLVLDESKQPFWYWKTSNISKNLIAIFRAQLFSVNNSIFRAASAIDAAAEAAAAAAEAAEAAAIYDSSESTYISYASASYSAAAASEASEASNVSSSASSAHYAATAATFASKAREIQEDMLKDMNMIENSKNLNPVDFLYSSLWMDSPPKIWLKLYKRFNKSLLALNEGFEIWVDWYKDRIDGVPLDFEKEVKWLETPVEILELDAKEINNYLKDVSKAGKKPLNLVRAIFIGDGAVGKTSIIKRLFGEEVVEGKVDMTPGIEIRKWEVANSYIKASFWDFGGQVMAHATHQFFLRERCLYILIVDGESEKNKRNDLTSYGPTTINDQAEYWLEHIKTFGKGAKVMLVGNKTDKYPVNLDMNFLKQRYDNILDFYPISCTNQSDKYLNRFKIFKDDLSKFLRITARNQVHLNKNYFKVLKEVVTRAEKESFLDHESFDKICKDHEINEDGIGQEAFLELLDILGVIIHFKELKLYDAYVLNPRWITHGIYELLFSKRIVSQQGKLNENDVYEILKKKHMKDEIGHGLKYPKNKCRFIIDAMHQFELCYRLSDEYGSFIIPGRLPEKQPDYLTENFNKTKEGTLTFEYDFTGLLPKNIIANFIVARHHEIKNDNENKSLVWQHGVFLFNKEYQTIACFQVNYSDKNLLLWLQDGESREYLAILRDEINRILGKINLYPKEYVHLPSHARIGEIPLIKNLDNEIEKVPYKRLLKEAKKIGQDVITSDSGVDYDLKKVMGFVMTEKQQKKVQTGDTFNTTFNFEKAENVIGPGKNHDISISTEKNYSINENETTSKKWYEKWWVFTFFISLVFGILSALWFDSLKVGFLILIFTAIIVNYLNPRKRYFRAAIAASIIGGFNGFPQLLKVIFSKEISDGNHVFILNWSDSTDPSASIAFTVLAIVLFILDYKENKKT